MEKIMLGGIERPISFGLRMGMIYEEHFKRSYQADFITLSVSQAITEAQSLPDIVAGLEGKTNIVTLGNIVWAALAAGARVGRIDVDFDAFDVIGWLDDNPEATAWIIQGIYNALPRDRDAAKKKTASNKAKPGRRP